MRTRSPLPIVVFAMLAAVTGVGAFAQQPAAPAVVAPGSPTPVPGDAGLADKPAAADAAAKSDEAAKAAAAAIKSKDAAGRDTLSVDFPDEDIRSILRNVADLFELNLAMPDALQGKTTVKLRDVTWRQIFQTVLSPVNYTYIEDGNIIKIVSNESLTQEPVSTEVFLINYARAADILPTITTLVDAAAGGKIVVDARSNALVITERPSRMNRIRPIIETLDRATDQVMIETKFVEVTDSDVKNIGVNWASLANYKVAAGPFNGNFDRTRGQTANDGSNRSNGTTGSTTNGTTGTNTNGTTATTNNQVSTTQSNGASNTGTVTSNNGTPTSTSTTSNNGSLDTNSSTTGANGTNNAITNGVNNAVTNTATNALNLLNTIANTGATSRGMTAVFSADQFALVLSALQTQNSVKIVSNPTIVTLNNTEATINVGQERPIPRYQYNQQTGNLEVNGFDFKPIGVILKVTPQVNSRGFIKLTVSPEVSQSLNSVTFNGNAIPIIDTRKALTQVSLKDGFTMGIGGLLTSSSSNADNKVPVLGSIPLLGRLFRSEGKRIEQTNLIIFITAKTISAEGAAVEQVFDSSRVKQLNMKREDLPGFRDGSNPFLPSDAKPGELNSNEKGPAKTSIFRKLIPEEKK